MAPSIPIRYLDNYLDNPVSQIELINLKQQLQLQVQIRREQAQIRRQNYGKAKEIYSGRNKWSKIIARPTTGMGAIKMPNCSCYGTNYTLESLGGGNYYCAAGSTNKPICP